VRTGGDVPRRHFTTGEVRAQFGQYSPLDRLRSQLSNRDQHQRRSESNPDLRIWHSWNAKQRRT
jgi:hypothetical protein